MILADCLDQVPSGMLRKLAARHGLPYVGEYVPDIIDSLTGFLLSRETLHPVLEDLPEGERTALELLALTQEDGLHRVRCHRQLRVLTGLSHEESRRQYVRLLRRGLVFQAKRGWEELYFMPTDLRWLVREWVLTRIAQEARASQAAVEARRVPGDLLVRQGHWFLAACKKSRPRITLQGRIYKRDQEDLYRRLGWPLPDVEGVFFTLDDRRHLEPVQFLLSYFERFGVINGLENRLRLQPPLDRWLALEPSRKHRSMLDYLFEEYIDSEAIRLILDSLALAEGSWVDWNSLITRLAQRTLDNFERASLLQLLDESGSGFWLSPLPLAAGLGLVEVGVSSAGKAGQAHDDGVQAEHNDADGERLALRWLPGVPEVEETFANDFFVQPTFELLVPMTADYQLLWNIELIADLQKLDLMCEYRLTRESVYRALEWGLDGDELRVFLADHARNPLPQNVAYSLDNWIEKYGRVRFTEGLLVECTDEETAGLFRGLPVVQEGRALDTGGPYFLIARDDHDEVVEALRRAGQLPSTTIRSLGSGESAEPRARLYPDPGVEQTPGEFDPLETLTRTKPRYLPLYRWHRSDQERLFGIPRAQSFTVDPSDRES